MCDVVRLRAVFVAFVVFWRAVNGGNEAFPLDGLFFDDREHPELDLVCS